MKLQMMIEFLMQNPDVLQKVKEGTASLIGVSVTEKFAILDVLNESKDSIVFNNMCYWK